ncbi:ankyrin repeat protein, partial [Metarhizium majus ARSEF 297]
MPAAIPPLVASVSSWNDRDLRVFCPWCDSLHQHDFDGNYEERRVEVAACNNSRNGENKVRSYKIQFPMNASSGMDGYEIDKDIGRFIAGGAHVIESGILNDDEINKRTKVFEDQAALKRPWTEATELNPAFSELGLRKIDVALCHMRHNKAWERTISDTAAAENDEVDLSNVFAETSGKTALHLAACYQCPDTIKLLLEYGADVNAVDIKGRTPLMEAALWGWPENVQVMLENGADKTLQCIHNCRLRRAIDFALPSKENARARRAATRGYKEDTFSRDEDRQIIVELLRDEHERSPLPRPPLFAFRKLSNKISLYFITHYEIPSETKTIACMVRPGGLPPVSAMSGWSHHEDESIQLPGRRWTDEVMRLCQLIKFSPDEWPQRDQGVPGQFNACHAEKQLIAYFVHKHVFLPSDISSCQGAGDELAELMGGLLLKEPASSETLSRNGKISRLCKIKPSNLLREATIMSSTPICPDCANFIKRVNEVLGLRIQLRHFLA